MEAVSSRIVPDLLNAPFLASKIQSPTRFQGLVERERLRHALREGDQCELTVVTGPAGSGKTSLLTDWTHAVGDRVAWLKLDQYDNDPAQFYTGLLASVASVADSGFQGHVGNLVQLSAGDQRVFLSAVGDALAEQPARLVLILDDLHEITNATIHDGLSLIADRLSRQLRVVVASRTKPPLGLARRRARRQLCEIRFDDLRFTVEESMELVRGLGQPAITASVASRLQRSTEGWAAAVYVAAIGLGDDGTADGSGSFADPDRHLSDYLLEEVLGRETADRRRFLLETSILDQLTSERCNAVTTRTDSAEVLRELELSSQFVRRIGPSGQWYSYHALLRDLLRAELAINDSLHELHRRAAHAALEEGDGAAAVHHAIEGNDLSLAATCIASYWIEFTNRGLFATVMYWLDRWRDADVRALAEPSDPTIFVVGSWMALHTGRLGEVDSWLARAEAHGYVGALPDGTSSIESAVAIVRCSHRRRSGSVAEAVHAGARAVELEADLVSPWRAVACVGHASALYWSGSIDQAQIGFEEAHRVGRATSLNVPVILSLGYLALIGRQQDEQERSLTSAQQAVDLASSNNLSGYDQAAPAFLALGLCHLDQIDLDQAELDLRMALDLASQGNECLIVASARLGLMRLAELRGDPILAARQLAVVQKILTESLDPGPVLIEAVHAAIAALPPGRAAHPMFPALTDRELTVLRYLRSHLTLPEIAGELYVSPNTVKTHAAAIRSKLGVTNRADAVRVAREMGLLQS